MKKRGFVAESLILAFILICFFTITALKAYSGKTKAKYPVGVDCDSITNIINSKYPCEGDECAYTSTNNTFSQEGFENYKTYAEYDKDYSLEVKYDGSIGYYTYGIYQCFCKEKAFRGKGGPSNEVCEDYDDERNKATMFSTLVSVLITAVNIIVRTINMKLVDYIG